MSWRIIIPVLFFSFFFHFWRWIFLLRFSFNAFSTVFIDNGFCFLQHLLNFTRKKLYPFWLKLFFKTFYQWYISLSKVMSPKKTDYLSVVVFFISFSTLGAYFEQRCINCVCLFQIDVKTKTINVGNLSQKGRIANWRAQSVNCVSSFITARINCSLSVKIEKVGEVSIHPFR